MCITFPSNIFLLDYEIRKDSLMMNDMNKQLNLKSKPSHYSCPGGKFTRFGT